MKQSYLFEGVVVGALAVAAFIAVLLYMKPDEVKLTGVPSGDNYVATTTAGNSLYGGRTAAFLVKTGPGTLGSVVITGANTGTINLYDATTTNITLRAASKATSSIDLGSFPASAAAGTYTFDVTFTDGLYVDLDTGNMPTTTITYR